MVRLCAFIIAFIVLSPFARAARLGTLIRCQLTDGYELALENSGRSYYLSLLSGSRVEYRQRLKRPLKISLDRTKESFNFELRDESHADYLVKIAAHFDGESSFNEMVHYRLRPRPKVPASYTLYEAAGDGLPLKELGCSR